MATNNIKIFDQNKANMLTDEAYNTSNQRLNGVQQGIASSQLQNKTLYQVSLVAYAIGQMMQANGLDANDADAVSTFANNMSQTIMQKVLDKANSDEAIAGTNNAKFITPATLKASINHYTGSNLKNNNFRNYTTVLEAANAAAPGGTFFATNTPDPLYNAADRPFNLDAEFQYLVLCDADNARKTVLAFNFNQSTGTFWYSRNIWQGKWNESTWKRNGESLTTTGIAANTDFTQRRFYISPQVPYGYSPFLETYAEIDSSSASVLYSLPNLQANIVFGQRKADNKPFISICNLSTGTVYTTNLDGYNATLVAYDDDACIVCYANSDSTEWRKESYRYSASSALTLSSRIGMSRPNYETVLCSQNAFTNNNNLVGICFQDLSYEGRNWQVSSLNKSTNQLTDMQLSNATPAITGGNIAPMQVRLNTDLTAILFTDYSAKSYVAVVRQDGNLYSLNSYNAPNNEPYKTAFGACVSRLLLVDRRNEYYSVVDVDGGHATNSVIRGLVYQLNDGACLYENGHYSSWTGPDSYPGISTAICSGLSISEAKPVLRNGQQGYLYENFAARFLVQKYSQYTNLTEGFACVASAVPYLQMFL